MTLTHEQIVKATAEYSTAKAKLEVAYKLISQADQLCYLGPKANNYVAEALSDIREHIATVDAQLEKYLKM